MRHKEQTSAQASLESGNEKKKQSQTITPSVEGHRYKFVSQNAFLSLYQVDDVAVIISSSAVKQACRNVSKKN